MEIAGIYANIQGITNAVNYRYNNQRRYPEMSSPMIKLNVKSGMSLCVPYTGLLKRRDAVGITMLLGFLESPEHSDEASEMFQNFIKEIRHSLISNGKKFLIY